MKRFEVKVLTGDCRTALAGLEPGSVQMCVTSPAYWLGQSADQPLGSSPGPSPHACGVMMMRALRHAHHVLRADGTLWLRLSDFHHEGSLFGFPWRVPIALRADGWRPQADLVVQAPGAHPAVHDRLILLSKSERYYCNLDLISGPLTPGTFVLQCVLAGSRPGDTVLDCFGMHGETAEAAMFHWRRAVLCGPNAEQADMVCRRLERARVEREQIQ